MESSNHVASLGACLLSEANDLKRPLSIVAQELNISLAKLERLVKGDLEVVDALDVLRRMSEVYPVPLNDLWLDVDDTLGGVRVCELGPAKASARILDRPDRSGARAPYYEYRDAAMSRCSQFRPEWIKILRVVTSCDPNDADVQLNRGHLMMQTTLFIGPVDFYYEDRHGIVHREEMSTGDSNYISPFVPHSFTARAGSPEAIIIAVTYGGRVRRAFTEFARVGADRVLSLAGDKRDPALTRRCILQRSLDAECMSAEDFVAAVGPRISPSRATELLQGAESSFEELALVASVLHVQVSDLYTCGMAEEEEVVVTRATSNGCHRPAARSASTYRLLPLARTRHQPDLKTFDVEVLDNACPGEPLCCGLHAFVYHFGSEAVLLSWSQRGAKHSRILRPGESAYIAPLVEHSLSVSPSPTATAPGSEENPNGAACGRGRRLFLVRIPGHLTGETLAEFATFAASGRERVGAETTRWYS